MRSLLPTLLLLSGCATPGSHAAGRWSTDTAFTPIVEAPPPILNENGGFPRPSGGLFSGRRAHSKGDLVTIRLAHNISADSSADTSLKRQTDTAAGVSALMGLEGAMANIGLTPAALIGATSTNDFDGSGGTKRSGELSGTLTAWVTDVLPNGLLVIGGRQAVKINNEVEVLALRGVVDPRAIDSNNVVPSSAIADARMEYTGSGVVAGKQAPGWLTRALDVVWPF